MIKYLTLALKPWPNGRLHKFYHKKKWRFWTDEKRDWHKGSDVRVKENNYKKKIMNWKWLHISIYINWFNTEWSKQDDSNLGLLFYFRKLGKSTSTSCMYLVLKITTKLIRLENKIQSIIIFILCCSIIKKATRMLPVYQK